MNIPKNTIAKIYGGYLFQNTTDKDYPILTPVELSVAYSEDKYCPLLLKPLVKLTDEDAIQVAKLMQSDMKIVVRDSNGNFLFICEEQSTNKTRSGTHKGIYEPAYLSSSIDLLEGSKLLWDDHSGGDGVNGVETEVSLECYQYLQSKGSALPYMQYSVEDLVKAGIYKLV